MQLNFPGAMQNIASVRRPHADLVRLLILIR